METTRLATIVTAALAIAPICAAQSPKRSPKLLQITSPANGAVVSPGDIVKVTVVSPANVRFDSVALGSPIVDGFSGVATSVPAEFSLRVPPDIACGKDLVSVMGRTISGQSIWAAIELDVERPDTPIQLSLNESGDTRNWDLELVARGEPWHLVVLATFSDGRILVVTESSRVTYRSSNTRVARVDRHGEITPVGIGSASVTVTYTNGNQNVRIAIPVNVKLTPY